MTKLKTNKTFIKQKPRIKIKRIKNEIKIPKAKRMIEKKKKTTGDKSFINLCHTPHMKKEDVVALLAT